MQNDPKFRLERAEDKDTKTILQSRLDVLRDPELTNGARNLFTLLLDYSLDPQMTGGGRRGQIMISTQKLCEHLSRCRRAIFGWTKELVAQRHVWVSKRRRPNTQPMNVFHITALQPKVETGPDMPGDGNWGNGYRRPEQPMPVGARGYGAQKGTYLVDQFGNPIFSKLLQMNPATRKICTSLPQNMREASAQNDTGHPQNMREASAQNDTYHPQNMRVAPANFAGESSKKEHPLRESLEGDQRDSSLSCSTAERPPHQPGPARADKQLSSSTAINKSWEEREFLEGLGKIAGPKELANWGGRWRNRFRENPSKATRVLAELRSMQRENRIHSNPGACANDLWERFV